jgi:Ca2+/Na+ antiporter
VVAETEGNGSLAVGNIAGTNMVNLLLILGPSALILPLAMQMQTLRFDLPVIAAAGLLLWALAANGVLSRLDGLVLLPAHGLVLDSILVRVDIPIMVVATLACVPIFITGRRVGRVEGGAMMVAYPAYLAFLLITQI